VECSCLSLDCFPRIQIERLVVFVVVNLASSILGIGWPGIRIKSSPEAVHIESDYDLLVGHDDIFLSVRDREGRDGGDYLDGKVYRRQNDNRFESQV
jgi:hypothetical protein